MPGKQRWSVNMGGQLTQVPMPVGYSGVSSYTGGDGVAAAQPSNAGGNRHDDEIAKLRFRKMWEAARSPISGVLMSAVMMYMVGNNIQIFPLIMIGMTCMNAVKGLFAVSSGLLTLLSFLLRLPCNDVITSVCCCIVFKPFSDVPMGKKLPAILFYLLIASAHVGVALWKLDKLGFLPTTASDWYLLMPFKLTNETAVGGAAYMS